MTENDFNTSLRHLLRMRSEAREWAAYLHDRVVEEFRVELYNAEADVHDLLELATAWDAELAYADDQVKRAKARVDVLLDSLLEDDSE